MKFPKFNLELLENGQLRTKMLAISGHAKLASGDQQAAEPVVTDKYMIIPFRALSAVMLPDRPVDFSEPGVVKAAAPMLAGLTMYGDHWTFIENWLGKTSNGRISEASGNMPEGIDFDANIYIGEDLLAADPNQRKLIIGLREGVITDCSVGINFNWKKSHDLKGDAFWDMLGQEVNGEIVRAIVTEITGIDEVSLVWAGADPNAKRLDMSKLPANLKTKYQKLFEHLQEGQTNELEEVLEQLTANSLQLAEQTEELKTKNEELKVAEQTIAEQKLTADSLQLTVAEQKEKLTATSLQLTEAEKQLTSIKSEKISQIKALMRLCGDDKLLTKEYEAYLESLQPEVCATMLSTYEDKRDKIIPLTCASCGSHDIARRSSVHGDLAAKPKATVNEEHYKC